MDTGPQAPVSRGAMRSLIDDDTHYIRGAGVEELYAWRSDPGETRDLARVAGAKPILDRLRLELNTALGRR